MKESARFGIDVGWTFLGSTITLLLGFSLGIVLARWLGPHELGLYRMTFTIYGSATLVTAFGISSALIKFVAEYKEDNEKLNQATSCGFTNALILGLILGAVIFFSSRLLANIFNMPELEKLLKILAIVLPFASFYNVQTGLLNGLRRMKLFAALTAGQSILMCISIISFVVLGFGVEGAITGLVLSVAGACFLGLFLSNEYFALNLKDYIPNTKKILSFGGKILGAGAANQINYYADIVLIGYFLAATQVGYYSIAVSLSRFFWIIPQAIQTVTYPATSEYWSKTNLSALQTMFDKSMKYSTCILLPLGLVVAFLAKDIITAIYGKEFIPAALPLLILLIATIIGGATTRPVGATLPAIGRPDLSLKITGASAILNIMLNIMLIPNFGIVGAAIATAFSLTVAALLNLTLIIKCTKLKIDLRWYTKAGSAVSVCILIYLLFRAINHYVVAGLIIATFLATIWFCLLTREDKLFFLTLIKMPKSYLAKLF